MWWLRWKLSLSKKRSEVMWKKSWRWRWLGIKPASGSRVSGFGVVHLHTSGRHEGREVRSPRSRFAGPSTGLTLQSTMATVPTPDHVRHTIVVSTFAKNQQEGPPTSSRTCREASQAARRTEKETERAHRERENGNHSRIQTHSATRI